MKDLYPSSATPSTPDPSAASARRRPPPTGPRSRPSSGTSWVPTSGSLSTSPPARTMQLEFAWPIDRVPEEREVAKLRKDAPPRDLGPHDRLTDALRADPEDPPQDA